MVDECWPEPPGDVSDLLVLFCGGRQRLEKLFEEATVFGVGVEMFQEKGVTPARSKHQQRSRSDEAVRATVLVTMIESNHPGS